MVHGFWRPLNRCSIWWNKPKKDGKTTNLHFLDAARTASDIQEAYLEHFILRLSTEYYFVEVAGQKIS